MHLLIFYTSFLAALHAEKYYEFVFGEGIVFRDKPIEHETLILNRRRRVKNVAKLAGMSIEELRKYNRDLKRSKTFRYFLPRGFELHLPPGKKEYFIEKVSGETKPRKQASRRDF